MSLPGLDQPVFLANGTWLLWLAPLYALWALGWTAGPRLARAWNAKGAREGKIGAVPALTYSSLGRLRRLPHSRTLLWRRLARGLRLVSVALLLLAMARPQTGESLTTVTTEGVDIILVLDTSGSMQALDLDADKPLSRRRNRLEVAKDVVEDFIAGRENDQIGLVVFGAEAFTQCPLTLDHGVLASFLQRVELGIAGDATALGSALGTAVKRLREVEPAAGGEPGAEAERGKGAASQVVILLTDGRNNAGALDPLQAAEIAKTFGVKVHTVAVGTRGPAPFRIETRRGPRYQEEKVEIDEETLRRIAEITGGTAFRAEETEALAQIYEQIDELEKREITTESYLEVEERFAWLVIPALALLLLETVLLNGWLRQLP